MMGGARINNYIYTEAHVADVSHIVSHLQGEIKELFKYINNLNHTNFMSISRCIKCALL